MEKGEAKDDKTEGEDKVEAKQHNKEVEDKGATTTGKEVKADGKADKASEAARSIVEESAFKQPNDYSRSKPLCGSWGHINARRFVGMTL